jgi:hypothetical protein
MKSMNKLILTTMLFAVAFPVAAFDRSGGGGRKLDAIANGRLYDRLLTPQLNPSFVLDYRAEQQLLGDLRSGQMELNDLPAPMRFRFDMMLQADN